MMGASKLGVKKMVDSLMAKWHWQHWDWQTLLWLQDVFLIVLLTVAGSVLLRWLINKVAAKAEQTSNWWDDCFVTAVRVPAQWLVWSEGLLWAAEVAMRENDLVLVALVLELRNLNFVALVVWFLVVFVREAEASLRDPGKMSKPMDATTAMAIGRILRTAIIITGALVGMQSLGMSVSGVMAFGGVGGIAVGFAARDLLANFFGGLMVYLDRPFKVGDWIRSPDKQIEGTVEYIGWRQTRIRTFDRRPLYVPNATFATISVENPSRMENRRIFEHVGIRYDDAEQARSIVAAVRQMIADHPDMEPARTTIVNVNAFGPSSIDFMVYAFTKTTDWVTFHQVKEDVLMLIYQIIADHGAQVAFPTQTLHITPQLAGLTMASQTGGEAPQGVE